ncbi:SDR family oxidoreductase [Rothia koreensis]|uniref:SDR family oxidoreductase n=1 Tax=Rothia koreensis TaxID=592378 RepID=UPI0037CAD322
MLVIGATGNIGSEVVNQLSEKGHKVRTLSRSPEKVTWPPHVEAVKGDLNDSIRTRNILSDVHRGQFR